MNSHASTSTDLLSRWPGAEAVFDDAWLALPDGTAGEFKTVSRRLARYASTPLPVVLFLTGSAERGQDKAVAAWFAGEPVAFIAPRTHRIPGRPAYVSPAPAAVYEQIHALRRAEIDYTLERLSGQAGVDLSRLCLVGLSEGAVAAASWAPERAIPRVVMSWPMEDCYFGRGIPLPAPCETPILNIMGGRDPYFGARGSLASAEPVCGHGGAALAGYPRAKVVIYPHCGHRVADDPRCALDVRDFTLSALGVSPCTVAA